MTCLNYDRIYAQYRDKSKAAQWYGIIPGIGEQFCTVYNQIATSYDIDTNEGAQLDVIGRVVGIDRSYEDEVEFFPASFGDSDSQFGGGSIQFGATSGNISSEVNDQIFRILLKAKIARNTSDATLDSIIEAVNFIVPTDGVTIIDNEDMSFSVSFKSPLDPVQRFVLDTFEIIPKPQGVRFLGYTEEPAITQFGGSYEFGDTRAQFGLFFGA